MLPFLSMSAWCLGILNSHRRFFISYTAPVAWNLVMIASLIGFGGHLAQFPLSKVLAWGSVVGSAAQFGVQLPQVIQPHASLPRYRWGWGWKVFEPSSVTLYRYLSAAA